MDGRSYNNEEYRFGFNGKEKEDGIGDGYDFGARIYDSRLGRWLALDPMQKKFPEISPYNFVGNSPLIFIDPNGKELILSFLAKSETIKAKDGTTTTKIVKTAAQVKASYEARVNNSLGGKYEVVLTPIEGTDNFKVSHKVIEKDIKLTTEQSAFTFVYLNIVHDPKVKVQIDIVYNSEAVKVGNFPTNQVDIGDINAFSSDKTAGGASSSGLLIHEHYEQFLKAKAGIKKGRWTPNRSDAVRIGKSRINKLDQSYYKKMHKAATKLEIKVSGNSKRYELLDKTKSIKGVPYSIFLEKNGKYTKQTITNGGDGSITVDKKRISARKAKKRIARDKKQ